MSHRRGPLARVADRIDWSDDRGTAGVEVLPIGILVLVVSTLMIMNLWAVIDTKMAVNAAAREGARRMAESDGAGDVAEARDAAVAALEAHKGPLEPGRFTFNSNADTWALCRPIEVTVSYSVGLINLPFLGAVGGIPPVTATHAEIVDPYRSRDAALAPEDRLTC